MGTMEYAIHYINPDGKEKYVCPCGNREYVERMIKHYQKGNSDVYIAEREIPEWRRSDMNASE